MTLLVNPVMGHLGITYARSYKKHLLMATRYDFNYFSYDSDLSVGLIYAPAEKNQLIKVRMGLQTVLVFDLWC